MSVRKSTSPKCVNTANTSKNSPVVCLENADPNLSSKQKKRHTSRKSFGLQKRLSKEKFALSKCKEVGYTSLTKNKWKV